MCVQDLWIAKRTKIKQTVGAISATGTRIPANPDRIAVIICPAGGATFAVHLGASITDPYIARIQQDVGLGTSLIGRNDVLLHVSQYGSIVKEGLCVEDVGGSGISFTITEILPDDILADAVTQETRKHAR